MPQIPITDAGDPRLAEFRGVGEGDRRFRQPPPAGARAVDTFVTEGLVVAERAAAAGYVPRALLVADRWAGQVPTGIPDDVPVYVAPVGVVSAVTRLGVVREVVGLFTRPPRRDMADVVRGARRVLVLEGVVNPVNMGTLLRTAAALGMDATLVGPGSVDPWYRRSLRGSMGAVLTHPWAHTGPFPDALHTLRAEGFRVLALTPAADAVPIGAVPVAAGDRVALLVGSEGPGLTPAAIQAADLRVAIPMRGGVDSLNVAGAAAIACHLLGGS